MKLQLGYPDNFLPALQVGPYTRSNVAQGIVRGSAAQNVHYHVFVRVPQHQRTAIQPMAVFGAGTHNEPEHPPWLFSFAADRRI